MSEAQLRPRLHRVNDSCMLLQVSRATLYKLLKQKKIEAVHVAGRTLIPDSEIERVVKEGA